MGRSEVKPSREGGAVCRFASNPPGRGALKAGRRCSLGQGRSYTGASLAPWPASKSPTAKVTLIAEQYTSACVLGAAVERRNGCHRGRDEADGGGDPRPGRTAGGLRRVNTRLFGLAVWDVNERGAGELQLLMRV